MERFLFLVFVALSVIATSYAETTCETHRRNSGNSPHGLNWNITCDENGNYHKIQCTIAPEKEKWCTCYNVEEPIKGPSRKIRHCDCALAEKEARDGGQSECDIPKCARDGKYEAKYCCGGKCHCVNPVTGVKTTEPANNPNINCPTN